MVENQLGDNDTIYGTFNLAEVMSEFPPDPGSAARHRAEILVKTDTLRVVLVTMLSGGFMHEHAAPGPITIQVLKGVMNLTVEGESRTLSAGELISLAPGIMHGVEGVEDGAFLLTIAHLSRIPDPGGDEDVPQGL
ncbi:MAG TPA: cupin domain-containing protein [Thermomicrobiales bacterium]|nr:cupin domain-containing protein [Thermomicrobiales bacterium]